MKYNLKKLMASLMVGVLFFLGASGIKAQAEMGDRNVLDFDEVSVHDPSIIKSNDTYYVFGSHVAAAKSTDLRNWEYFVNNNVGDNTLLGNIRENFKEVFKWAGNGQTTDVGGMGIWAPDVYYSESYKNSDGTTGAYLMYFSLSTGQDVVGVEHYRSLIGLAVSKDVEGPYLYEDTVIYTGFRNQEDDYGYWPNSDFDEVFPNETPNSRYFRENGTYNFDNYPNAIDPTIVDGEDGRVYMVYGSWNGGVWILEISPETGLVINRPSSYNNGVVAGNDRADSYFGTRIFGGYWQTGEGPYIQYHEETGYYHLYMTYGTLDQAGTYNMRFFRSKDIMGPYVDINGEEAYLASNSDISRRGNKLYGSVEFAASQTIAKNAGFFSYRVPGHNSVYYDDESGVDYIVFHTRFSNKGEGHEVRVHQILWNDEGWPLIPLQRYNGETVETDVNMAGNYVMVNQGKDTNSVSKDSFGVTLESDGSITGAHKGSWSFEDGELTVTLTRDTFKGYVLTQSTQLTDWHEDLTITLMDDTGVSLLGARVGEYSTSDLLYQAKEDLIISRTTEIVNNMFLPTEVTGGVKVSWSSDTPEVIGNKGTVNLQDYPVEVTLTATLRYSDLVETKEFKLETAGLIYDKPKNDMTLPITISIGVLIVGAGVYGLHKKRNRVETIEE